LVAEAFAEEALDLTRYGTAIVFVAWRKAERQQLAVLLAGVRFLPWTDRLATTTVLGGLGLV
jgi:hypothetical protein